MNDGQEVIIKNRVFTYNSFYKRLESEDGEITSTACPMCNGDLFKISYGTYECIANCSCGNSFIVYDG